MLTFGVDHRKVCAYGCALLEGALKGSNVPDHVMPTLILILDTSTGHVGIVGIPIQVGTCTISTNALLG